MNLNKDNLREKSVQCVYIFENDVDGELLTEFVCPDGYDVHIGHTIWLYTKKTTVESVHIPYKVIDVIDAIHKDFGRINRFVIVKKINDRPKRKKI